MKTPVKILHIDTDYQVAYWLIFEGTRIKSHLSMEIALSMLENELFDLILSEPQNMAVLTARTAADNLELLMAPFYKNPSFYPPNWLN